MTYYAEFLALISAVFAVIMAIYVVMIKRQLSRSEQFCSDLIDDLSKEINGISHGSMGIGRKALALEERINVLEEQLQQLKDNDPTGVSYQEASRLVELGAGIEDLMSNCGISRPEAELVTALSKHGIDKVPILVQST